jgi:hypothetical protein
MVRSLIRKKGESVMFLKRLTGLVFAGALAFSAMAAEIVVKLAPPKIVVEKRGHPPSPDHVWVSGYQRWDGNAYHWNEGKWEQPPRHHAHWVAHHWVHRNGGYVLVDGHWN